MQMRGGHLGFQRVTFMICMFIIIIIIIIMHLYSAFSIKFMFKCALTE